MFMREVCVLHVHDKDLMAYLKAKGSCILTRYLEDFLQKYSAFIPYYADELTARIIKADD